jgi:hypothetical protein
MNFNILNPNAFYSSQQVQKSTQADQGELVKNTPSSERAYVSPIAPQDTVTLSQRAMSGAQSAAVDNNTYGHLITSQRISNSTIGVNNVQTREVEATGQSSKIEVLADIDVKKFLSESMKTMVENRLGVDKEKIKNIEAMIEGVAKDESLSAEEKEKQIAQLQEMIEKEYEKAAEKQQ